MKHGPLNYLCKCIDDFVSEPTFYNIHLRSLIILRPFLISVLFDDFLRIFKNFLRIPLINDIRVDCRRNYFTQFVR